MWRLYRELLVQMAQCERRIIQQRVSLRLAFDSSSGTIEYILLAFHLLALA